MNEPTAIESSNSVSVKAARGQRIVIIGGVAGGASAATRARRACETCEIIMFERGPNVSFASCGLAYHVGGVIEEEADLLVASPQTFIDRFAIDVRIRSEVTRIDRERKIVFVTNLETNERYEQPYDTLLLSPGALPILPPIAGIDLPHVHSLRSIADARKVRGSVDAALLAGRRAVVVGAGFIGLELAENLHHRGLDVTILERGPQVMPNLDPEIAGVLSERLSQEGIRVLTDTSAVHLAPMPHDSAPSSLEVTTDRGQRLAADLVLFAVGVRPENTLAKDAGLALGERGGIAVDETLQTSDPHIWAAGDAIEVVAAVTKERAMVPLAGPANRQGRMAADNMVEGSRRSFGTVSGTSVIAVFDLTAAGTGATEAALRRSGRDYQVVYTHPSSHAGYFPGAVSMNLKLLFDPSDGTILGAQAVGKETVERRIDVIATAMQLGAKVSQLAQLELCYAPQYGSAKDPVNQIGMLAENVLSGAVPLQNWNQLDAARAEGLLLLDVRSNAEIAKSSLPGSLNIPIEKLRQNTQLLEGKQIAVLCASGQRAYVAVRLLRQLGFDARLLSGGMKTHRLWETTKPSLEQAAE